MASNMHPPTYGSDPISSNTTFVQADPSTFRAVVQKLTGASDDLSSAQKPHIPIPKPATEMGPRKPAFKLHERRQSSKKLQLTLQNASRNVCNASPVLASPVSPLEMAAARGSPRTPREVDAAAAEEDEERAVIAEKGFYLRRSPMSTPRRTEPPELLPLFPLTSPRNNINNSS